MIRYWPRFFVSANPLLIRATNIQSLTKPSIRRLLIPFAPSPFIEHLASHGAVVAAIEIV